MIDPNDGTPLRSRRPLSGGLVALAGLLGAAGVSVSAAAAHRGGGSTAATAGLFCLLHAGAVLALAALFDIGAGILMAIAAVVLVVGTALFSGDLALAGLLDWRPLPLAAPLGGGAIIIGWLTVVAGGLIAATKRR